MCKKLSGKMIGLRGRKCNIEKKVNSDEQLVNGQSMEGEKTKRERSYFERGFFFFFFFWW